MKYLLLNDEHKLWPLPRGTDVHSLGEELAAAIKDHTTVTIDVLTTSGSPTKAGTLQVDGTSLDWWTVVGE